MKEKEEKLLTILVYKDIKDHKIDFPIASYTIPNDIHENFKLPENTEKIIIQELDYNGEYFKDKELLTVYLGEEKMLNEILFSHKKIILDAKILKEISLEQKESTKKVLIKENHNNIIIKKIIEKDEKILTSLSEIEYFIKRLTEQLLKTSIETEIQKKYLTLNN